MQPKFVSTVAILICGGILAIVCAFGYARYKAAEAANAAFQAQLQSGQQGQAIQTQMPAQMPPHFGGFATPVIGATPAAGQPP
jgi:predicted negative regulator of RcsB-dependent stress response